MIQIRPRAECRYDAVALGEVMLRLDPGEGRIRTARRFDVWEGGGEYNVVRALARVFGLRTSILTALVDDEVGRLIEGLILAGGVDSSRICWRHSDGVGRSVRNGLNFTERGFGVRGAKGVSDRGMTAMSQLTPDALEPEGLFGGAGVRWFHTGGVCAALSEQSALTVSEIIRVARRHGTVVSYDLNYRQSLWRSIGGRARAVEVNRELVRDVDVLIGNEEDFEAALGFSVEGVDADYSQLPVEGFARMMQEVVEEFPNLQVVAVTLRQVRSASCNDWAAVGWSSAEGLCRTARRRLEILDRVGGGDSFASGMIHGLLTGCDLHMAVERGAAHGALAMTTPGDTSMATLDEVLKLAEGGNARVDR